MSYLNPKSRETWIAMNYSEVARTAAIRDLGSRLDNITDELERYRAWLEEMRTIAIDSQKRELVTEQKLHVVRRAVEKIYNLGHNDDCIFCGLKDKVAKAYVDSQV